MSDRIPAPLPEPPYYAVVFSSQRTPGDNGYGETAERMAKLAAEQPGYLGMDAARAPGGFGITVAYFADEESVAAWKRHAEHREAQRTGRQRWYQSYALHIAKVERAYRFDR